MKPTSTNQTRCHRHAASGTGHPMPRQRNLFEPKIQVAVMTSLVLTMKKSKHKKHTKKQPRSVLAKSMRAAESLTGLPPHVIQNAKSNGCQAFKANGTVNCDELLEFVAIQPA